MRLHRILRMMGVAVLLVMGSALMGCSLRGDDAADTPIGQALIAKLQASSFATSEEEARCVAGGIVAGIGEDRLEELGFTPDDVDMIEDADFTDDEISAMVDVFFECVDVRQMLAANLATGAGDEVAGCVAENVPEDVLRDFFAASNFGADMPSDSDQAFRDVAAQCGLPVEE